MLRSRATWVDKWFVAHRRRAKGLFRKVDQCILDIIMAHNDVTAFSALQSMADSASLATSITMGWKATESAGTSPIKIVPKLKP